MVVLLQPLELQPEGGVARVDTALRELGGIDRRDPDLLRPLGQDHAVRAHGVERDPVVVARRRPGRLGVLVRCRRVI